MLKQVSGRRVFATWTPPAGFSGATYRVYINTMNVNTAGIPVGGVYYISNTYNVGLSVSIQVRATTGTYLGVPVASSTVVIVCKSQVPFQFQ